MTLPAIICLRKKATKLECLENSRQWALQIPHARNRNSNSSQGLQLRLLALAWSVKHALFEVIDANEKPVMKSRGLSTSELDPVKYIYCDHCQWLKWRWAKKTTKVQILSLHIWVLYMSISATYCQFISMTVMFFLYKQHKSNEWHLLSKKVLEQVLICLQFQMWTF